MTMQQPEALRLADKYEAHGFLGDHRFAKDQWCSQAAAELRRQHARIAELEDQMAAIGAGGVEPLRKRAEASDLAARQREMQLLGEIEALERLALNVLKQHVAEATPIAWYVTGCSTMLDEHDAKAEAKRCGGSAKAVPLYTRPADGATAQAAKLLAADHIGMKVDYRGLFSQVQRTLKRTDPFHAEMLRQLEGHLQELGQRWYAGDTAVVDELLQLYSVECQARDALAAQAKQ